MKTTTTKPDLKDILENELIQEMEKENATSKTYITVNGDAGRLEVYKIINKMYPKTEVIHETKTFKTIQGAFNYINK